MQDIFDLIFKTKNSKSFIEYNNYHKNNILGFTKVSRYELMHSNFIAWLLDDSTSVVENHSQLYGFVLMLHQIKNDVVNANARLDDNIIKRFLNNNYIQSSKVLREFNNIDILLEITTMDNKILPIIIENKVNSKENGKYKDQTIVYFDHCEDYYKDKSKNFDPIYILLEPGYNKTKPKCEKYLIMTYQNLVDYIIEPTLHRCNNEIYKCNIRTYLQCLSYQKDNDKGDKIMAISREEKDLLKQFLIENEDLFKATVEIFSDDLDPQTITSVNSAFDNVMDKTEYVYNSKKLGKGRLVLEVITKYCNDFPNITFNELKKIFPNNLIGNNSKGCIELENKVSDKDKGFNGGHKRYFTDSPITLINGEVVLVNSQWKIDNINLFVDHCKNQLNLDISISK